MRTLLLESMPGAGAEAAEALAAAGHDVARCHQPGAAAFPCVGLATPGTCPMDGADHVDVALVVRTPTELDPTATEVGVTCASRRGIPVVVAGEGAVNPFSGWATETVEGSDLVAACERAIEATSRRRAEPLEAEAVRMLAQHDIAGDEVEAVVTRTRDNIHILVRVPAATSDPLAEAIATRVHAVDRAAHDEAAVTDVAVERLPV